MEFRPFIYCSPLIFLVIGFVSALGQKPAAPEPSTPEEIKRYNDDRVAEVSKLIAGKENQPAEKVFKDIKLLNGVPAARVVQIMQNGFSKSLGTTCDLCHVPGKWDSDEKSTKEVARDMMKMSHTINFDILKNIKGIKSPNPTVNCTTCHRGQLKPALSLEATDDKK